MKYAILGLRDEVDFVLDVDPGDDLRSMEVTDEQALAISGSPFNSFVLLDGEIVRRSEIAEAGDRLRWDEELKKLVRLPAPLPPVPASVPLWAFRQVLIEDGLLASILGAVQGNPSLSNFLEYGNFVDRNSPALATLASQLGKTTAEVDNFFRRASVIRL